MSIKYQGLSMYSSIPVFQYSSIPVFQIFEGSAFKECFIPTLSESEQTLDFSCFHLNLGIEFPTIHVFQNAMF